MISIKGFAAKPVFANNTPSLINPIGELSTYALTFSKDCGIYWKDAQKTLVLTTFSTKKDGVHVQLSVDTSNQIFRITDWIYELAIAKNDEVYALELLQDLIDEFGNEANNFKCGNIITDGNIWMPQWVSWKVVGAAEETNIRIWFSDENFRQTYDEYEIVVVPPIVPLDDFFKASSKVKELLDAIDPVKKTNDIMAARDGKPETILRTEMFLYNDPFNATIKYPTYWNVLIYGEAGNNIDSIKDALIDHILDNSTHTREEWTKVFPDIFKRTEFILLPDWWNYAIPNRVTEAGIYSPILTVKDIVPELAKFSNLHPVSHVTNYAQVVGHPYKSMQLSSCSSNENRDNKFLLTDFFPDYIAVSSTSQDFNRQSTATREWSEMLMELIILAEDMTEFSDIPRKYTRLKRGGKLYVVGSYGSVHYLVVAKANYPAQP